MMAEYGSISYDSDKESALKEVVLSEEKPLFKRLFLQNSSLFVSTIFYVMGMTTLLPWKFFITAYQFWCYKFRAVERGLHTRTATELQIEFTASMSFASNVSTVIFFFINGVAVFSECISLRKRIVGSLALMLILFVVATTLVEINTDEWQDLFFALTIGNLVLMNVAGAITSGTLYEIIGKFSLNYIRPVMNGQAMGGIFAAVVQIICISITSDAPTNALVYFMIGNVIILLSIVFYFILSKTVFFKYDLYQKIIAANEIRNSMSNPPEAVSYWGVFQKMWLHGVSWALVYIFTLIVHPGISVLVESEAKHTEKAWNYIYFEPTVNYLFYNVGDYIGREAAFKFVWPTNGMYQLALSLLRFIFIPLILLCNLTPSRQLLYSPVFDKDYMFIIIIFALAVTNGYLATIAALCTSFVVEKHEKATASNMLTVFIGIALTIGSGISLIIVKYFIFVK